MAEENNSPIKYTTVKTTSICLSGDINIFQICLSHYCCYSWGALIWLHWDVLVGLFSGLQSVNSIMLCIWLT